MPKYVDGFVIPIKKANANAYKKMASLGRKIWLEHGALDYYECIGDDLDAKWGIPFPSLCKLKSSETIVFAFIVFKSKAHRNRVNAKVHKDPRMAPEKWGKIPFDMKRFAYGGFKVIVN